MKTLLLALTLFSMTVYGSEKSAGAGEGEPKGKASLTKFERAVLDAPLIAYVKGVTFKEIDGVGGPPSMQATGTVFPPIKNVTGKIVRPQSKISVVFKKAPNKTFMAAVKKGATIFLLKPAGESYVPVLVPDTPLYSRKDLMRIKTTLNKYPPKDVPVHDCCHNRKKCCGMTGCCFKTACINAHCLRLKTR